ncbi:helix-turn-helix domain-containing protein [Variovorax sp. YR216]|uniref:helix-turn-helix domain-containing protein n=1 Tax=Variovorax sp. YR216 TaxID=1882828 RepID=UPI00210F00B0|nr:helix-turn-helix domain-containing protein [Variovorax sp. YR216]
MYDSNIMRAPGSQASSIRSYSLFGESSPFPDVLHCETIAARSMLHSWELASHRHSRLHQLLLLRTGRGMAWLEAGSMALGRHTLVNIPVGDVHAFSFSPGTQGWVLSLPDELLAQQLANEPRLRQTLARAAAIPLKGDFATGLISLFSSLWAAYGEDDIPGRSLVLLGLGTAVLGLAGKALAEASEPVGGSASSRVLRNFEALLEKKFASAWRVRDYAKALGVTPTHLSRVARSATGLPVSRLVDARRMREARRLLAYTTASVAAIGELLGFDDPAHFSRVFSRTCGCSPRAFRASVTQLT